MEGGLGVAPIEGSGLCLFGVGRTIGERSEGGREWERTEETEEERTTELELEADCTEPR